MIQDNFSLLKRVSENIRYFRTVNNLSQEELANLAELDRTYISGVERGVQALNISNEDFFKTMF